MFDVFGADKIAQFNIQVGEELNVYFDVDAREWNGRWFNSIRAWKVDRVSAQAPVAPDAPFPPMNAAPAAPVDFAFNRRERRFTILNSTKILIYKSG